MSDVKTDETAGALSSPRLSEFQDEVAKLKVSGGGANPERRGAQWGIGLTIVGIIVVIIAWVSGRQDTQFEYIQRDTIGAMVGVAITIVGVAIWLRNSITRYLRYWLVRLIYEQREQTDRLIEALREK
jgi:hypothetical protein